MKITIVIKKSAKIDPSNCVQRVVADKLLICGSRRGTVTASMGKTPQLMQCQRVCWQAPQEFNVTSKCLVVHALGRKVLGAIKKRFYIRSRLRFWQRHWAWQGFGHVSPGTGIGPRLSDFHS